MRRTTKGGSRGAGWSEEFERLLRRVEKPGRYIGGEWNEIRKDPDAVDVKVGLVFPDVYEIGMSHLGQKILYGLLNAQDGVAAERVFAPWPDMERELRASNTPLFTLENKIPLSRLDILGFSLLYELNATNILTILDLSGIPASAAERSENHPLIVAGGPAAFNPEPLADLFDVFVLGDGEEAVLDLVDLFRSLRREGASRRDRLRAFARLPGMYVPMLYRAVRSGRSPFLVPRPEDGAPARVTKRAVRDFSRSFFPSDIIVPDVQAVFDRVAVEASRGCPHRCRFCQATSLYFPFRVKDPNRLMEATLDSVRSTGFQDASLSSLSIGDYPYLEPTVRLLMNELSREDVSLSLPSLRPQCVTSALAESILRVRKTGFTLVPEAGTERLRRVINKDLNDDDVRRAAEIAFTGGWRLLKLYFMIGLPGERDEDLEGIVRLVKDVLARGERILGFPPYVNLRVSSFIPKPHTPFQWLAMEEIRTLREKRAFLVRELRTCRSVNIKAHRLEQSVLEAVFSRGDRSLVRVLRTAWRDGARFDGWKDSANDDIWNAAFEKEGVDRKPYLGAVDLEADLPWDHIATGLRKEHLAEELRRALREEATPSCLETACGACRGCAPEFRPEKSFKARVSLESRTPETAGEPSPEPVRYRAFYGKSGRARYLAHNDLINVLRRSFRRADLSVLRSGGFHPQMRMSFLPAMPLGMAGLTEALEFKSDRLVEESEFLDRVNRSLPEGIRFTGLKRLAADALVLSRDTAAFVYVLDVSSSDVRRALEAIVAPEGGGEDEERKIRSAAEALRRVLPPETVTVTESWGEKKISFRVEADGGKAPRLQDAIADVLGIKGAPFFLTRESVIYHSN
ncbi:MAG: TIGR03960 family B12-binding radical SAM protein [Candidatus Aminicenantes bacterium]|nr:TIGR03960 family B12-binding radical SAM protein [Candidatus Aminicenantes bacterium]